MHYVYMAIFVRAGNADASQFWPELYNILERAFPLLNYRKLRLDGEKKNKEKKN